MTGVFWVLPSIFIAFAVLVATAPLGLPPGASKALQMLPYMAALVFIARGKGLVPSPVVFLAGIVVDLAGGGPLGFWALIYLFGVLITRQMAASIAQTQLGRLSGLLLIIFALSAAQVAVASLYQLKWIEWHGVLAGTAISGLLALAIDLVWREWQPERDISVTMRGGRRSMHV